MNVVDLITKIKDLLSKTTSIINYCQTTYSKAPTVFIGVDIRNVPRVESYPLLMLYDIKIERRLDAIVYVVSIGIGIENNDIQQDNNVFIYKGYVEGKRLKELIEDVS